MAKLAEAVYFDHKDRYNYFSLPSFTWNKRKYTNHNELLRKVDGVDGIKTGFTNASGYNLMASAKRDGHRVIAVMLGGTTGRSRDQHVADLLEAAFLEVSGVPAGDDLRARIAFGERGDASADDLALAQLRKLQTPDAALVSATDPALVAALEDEGTTEEGDEDGEAIAEGDADQTADDVVAAPAPIAAPVVAAPATNGVLVTSEVPAGLLPDAYALSQLALPVN
jgi:D-alanyl-D-alanine carboxypeptidase